MLVGLIFIKKLMADSDSSVSRRSELTLQQRQKIACELISCSEGGRLMQGSITKISVTNGCSAKTVSRIWQRARRAVPDGVTSVLSEVASRKYLSGRKKIDRAGALRRLKDVPFNKRREGGVPVSIICDPSVLAEAREAIDDSLTFSL